MKNVDQKNDKTYSINESDFVLWKKTLTKKLLGFWNNIDN
jgi:hypothetical protein